MFERENDVDPTAKLPASAEAAVDASRRVESATASRSAAAARTGERRAVASERLADLYTSAAEEKSPDNGVRYWVARDDAGAVTAEITITQPTGKGWFVSRERWVVPDVACSPP